MVAGGVVKKEQKQAENKKKKKKGGDNGDAEGDDLDIENLDWWSKYHASVETMIRVNTALLSILLLLDVAE